MSNEIKLKQLLELVEINNELFSQVESLGLTDSQALELGYINYTNHHIIYMVAEENDFDFPTIEISEFSSYRLDELEDESLDYQSIWADNNYNEVIKYITSNIEDFENILCKI